jgi:hypothetical protein
LKETPQQYIARVLGLQNGRNPNRILAATPKKIERLLRGKSRSQLTKRPTPKQWSVAEIVAHMGDSELVMGYRVRTILGNPGTPLQAFDQDEWARVGRYHVRDTRASLKLFTAIRAGNLALWKSLSAGQWKSYGVHAERGEETVERIWRHDAGHDLNHLSQISAILQPKKQSAGKKKSRR